MRMVLMCAAFFVVGIAGTASAQTTYHKKNVFTGNGYSDKSLGNGSWRVQVNVDARSEPSSAAMMALLRSGELALAAGYPFVQVIHEKSWGVMMTYQRTSKVNHYTTVLRVRGARHAGDLARCEIKDRAVCPIFQVDSLVSGLQTRFPATS